MTQYNIMGLPSTAAMAGALFQGQRSSNPRFTLRFQVNTGMRTTGPVETSLVMAEEWEVAITGAKQTDVNNLGKMEIVGRVIAPERRKGSFVAKVDVNVAVKPGHLEHKAFRVKS